MPIRRRGRGVVDFPKIENPRGEPLEMMIYSIPWESHLPESTIPIVEISINSIMRRKRERKS